MRRNMNTVASENLRTENWDWYNLLTLPCYLYFPHSPCALSSPIKNESKNPTQWPSLGWHSFPHRPCSARRPDFTPPVFLWTGHTSSPCMPTGKENGVEELPWTIKINCHMAFFPMTFLSFLFNLKGADSLHRDCFTQSSCWIIYNNHQKQGTDNAKHSLQVSQDLNASPIHNLVVIPA